MKKLEDERTLLSPDVFQERADELRKEAEEKQNELNRQGLAREIDRKWGLGTWEAIQNERTKRLKAKAEREETEKKQRRKKKDQLDKLIHKILVEGGKALIIISALLGMIYFLIWAAEKGGSA